MHEVKNSLEKWTGPKDWPRNNIHHRLRPAGNKASEMQEDCPLGSPEASTENVESADRERKTDTRDRDASEITKIKQVDPSNRVHLKQLEDTQGKDLKGTPRNIGNKSCTSCNKCNYGTNRKDKLADHLQDHYGSKRNNYNKT